MHFFVIKVKYMVFGVLAVIMLVVVGVTSGPAVSTFLSGSRELPIYSVAREDNKIALTFDCAWNADDIDSIVDALGRYNCKATFFVTGKWAEDYATALNKLYRGGHEIGIHSYNHDDYTKMSSDEILADMEKCDGAVMKATGYRPLIARAPSGAYNDNVVQTIEKSGRKCIQWSVDGLDYTDTTIEEIKNRVLSKTKKGDIILLHNGTKLTAEALPQIIEQLKNDYELVTVTEMIYQDNFELDHTGRQIQKTIY